MGDDVEKIYHGLYKLLKITRDLMNELYELVKDNPDFFKILTDKDRFTKLIEELPYEDVGIIMKTITIATEQTSKLRDLGKLTTDDLKNAIEVIDQLMKTIDEKRRVEK